ncbi:MAG: winged helix-turn-helix domain-containing protein [Hymenobacter sp.]
MLTSAQLAHLCQELNATLYTDCESPAGLAGCAPTRCAYSFSGLTDLLHRLGFTYKLTTPVPCQADAAGSRPISWTS